MKSSVNSDSWRGLLICRTGVWGFFFIMERIFLSSAVEFFLGPFPITELTSALFLLNYVPVGFGQPRVWPMSLTVS